MNNETIGISAELAIADTFGIAVNPFYRERGDEVVKNNIQQIVYDTFIIENIPFPVEHVAYDQCPVDFILENNQTLSVKTNMGYLSKVAPQIIGQPTAETYFNFLYNACGFDVKRELDNWGLYDNYENRANIFKKFSMENICYMLTVYWKNLFHCDYYIHFYNIINRNKTIREIPSYIVLKQVTESPLWDINYITFTKELSNWNECNTVKYHNIVLGEFQAHNHRNCLKFRFNIRGILELQDKGYI